jgi:hypothetical protein
MATKDEIYQAIRNADAAGDSDSVRKLAAYLQTMDTKPVETLEPDIAAKIAAHPITRFAVGAASPIIGVADRLAGNSGVLQRFDELAKQGGANGLDIAGFAGNVLNPLGLGLAKTIPVASTLMGRTAQGAGMGALGGYVAPAENQTEALKNAGYGAVLGGIIPGVVQGVGKAYESGSNALRNVSDLFTKEGPTNIVNRYIRSSKVVGEPNLPAILQRTSQASPLIPGSSPTVAQVTADMPQASPLLALENITAKTGGGPSAAFGTRTQAQNFASQVAGENRDLFTAPMRETALAAANSNISNIGPKIAGVPAAPIIAQIDQLASKPGDRASDVVQKTLGSVRSKLEALGSSGPLDARDLYTIRKEIGNTIQTFSKETANWDKNLTSKLEREIQLKIDDAIEAAGGTGWKAYLKEFAVRSKAIDADTARRELVKNPLQTTNLGGGLNIGEETRPHLPNLLSRPAMALNFLMRKAGYGVEPKIDEQMAKIFLDPQEFTRVMSTLPPKTQVDLAKALQRANALSFGSASAQ